jgi:hypothetical protein
MEIPVSASPLVRRLGKFCACLLVACAAAPSFAMAQDTAPPAQGRGPAADLPEADKAAIAQYTISEDAFTRLLAVTDEARKAGIKPNESAADFSKVHNLDDLANQVVSSDPRIKPLITQHGFTPRDFLLVNLALSNAAMAIQAEANPEQAKYVDQGKINKANVAFVEAHRPQIMQLMRGD